jgi:DNA invertase Pin-like site-specific DNA recombinase
MIPYLVYVRRSYRTAGDADVSDEAQVAAAVAMLPAGAAHEVIADSGGHHSGRTDDRAGFREVVRRVRAGQAAGVVVYDVSRLARNARLVLEFRDAMAAARIPLLIATLPNTRWDTAAGGLVLTTLAAAAAYQADMDSERARSLRRQLFEDGYHRGHPPYGYRNGRAGNRRILEVDPERAEVVRRIFAELATAPLSDVAAGLERDGVPAPTAQGWSRYVVREIALRAKVYLGLVVSGVEERPGRHEPIITPELHRDAVLGLRARDGGGRRSGPDRTYLLSGVLRCDCGRRMVGHYGRGGRRYYWCRSCGRPMIRAEVLEPGVLDAIRTYRVTPATMDLARAELARRLAVPDDDATGQARRRLEGRLAALRKQHGWGHVDDATYLRERSEVEAMLAALPDPSTLVSFDRHRAVVLDMAEALEVLHDVERKRVVALFVEELRTDGRIRWAAPFRPFFALAAGAGVSMVSPEGSDPAEDTLAWWTA